VQSSALKASVREKITSLLREKDTEPQQRIQLLQQSAAVLIVLRQQAQGDGCHCVVAPALVQAAEEVAGFLQNTRGTGVTTKTRQFHS